MGWRSRRRKFKSTKLIASIIFLMLMLGSGVFLFTKNGNSAFEDQQIKTVSVDQTQIIKTPPVEGFYDKLTTDNVIRILVIGDSIGAGAGVKDKSEEWASLLSKALHDKYNSTVFIDNVAVGGSTVFGGYSDYLKNRKNLKDQYDVVFVCFGQNDQGLISLETYEKLYERLIRTVKSDKGNPEIIGIIESSIKSNKFPDKLIELSKYYDFPLVDTRETYANSGFAYNDLTNDGVHPNAPGYVLYKDQIMKLINDNLLTGRKVTEWADNKIAYKSDSKAYIDLKRINSFSKNLGFGIDSNSYFAKNVGDYIETTFNGKVLGLSLKKSLSSGIINVYVDNVKITEYDMYTSNSFPIGIILFIQDNLSEGEHKLKIEISDKKNKDSIGNEVSLIDVIAN